MSTKPVGPSIGPREDWEPLLSQQARTKLQEIEKAAFERGKLEGMNLAISVPRELAQELSRQNPEPKVSAADTGMRAPFAAQVETEAIDAESRRVWNSSPDIQAEFGSLDRYVAFRRAEARGDGRVFPRPFKLRQRLSETWAP